MSDERIEFRWEVADGYAGKSRPQRTRIDRSDLLDCDTEADVKKFVEDAVSDDFQVKITPEWDDRAMARIIATWKRLKAGGDIDEVSEDEDDDDN